jgi:predicted metal-binding transcription factor (methanogenesis marker protein 9)
MKRFSTLGSTISFITLAVISTFNAFILRAENQVGRLPDGKAFRVDEQGTEVVDHLAELELQNQTLQTQLQALENDLTAKEETIARLSKDVTTPQLPVIVNKVAKPTEIKVKTTKPDISKKELAKLEKQLYEIQVREAKIKNDSANALAELQSRLLSSRSEYNKIREQKQQLEAKVTQCNQALSAKNIVPKTTFKTSLMPPSNSVVFGDTRSPEYRSRMRSIATTTNTSYVRPISTERNNALILVNKVNARITERNNLYRIFLAKKDRTVSFSPNIPRTKQGESVAVLKSRILNSESTEDIKEISVQLQFIESMMNQDIRLIERLG